jgi:nucleoside-diphosphate-sugar epimerase
MSESKKRVLVTGASGFIGGHACEALLRAGYRVRALMRPTSDASHLAGLDVERAEGDLSDADSLRRACKGVDVVVHTAAPVGSFGEWEHFHEVGVLGTQRLIDATHAAGASRFVHVSSIAVYGFKAHHGRPHEDTPFEQHPEPWNHYVREKVMAEELLWKAHAEGRIQATALRPVVVIGARDRNAVPRLVDLLRLPVTALPGQAGNHFPVVTIEDCVDALVRAVANDASIGRAYNVSGDDRIRLDDFFALLARHARLPAPKLYLPTGLMVAAVGLLEWAWKLLRRAGEPVATRIAIVVSGFDYDIDCTRARRELGWSARGSYEAALVAALAQANPKERGSARSVPEGAAVAAQTH